MFQCDSLLPSHRSDLQGLRQQDCNWHIHNPIKKNKKNVLQIVWALFYFQKQKAKIRFGGGIETKVSSRGIYIYISDMTIYQPL